MTTIIETVRLALNAEPMTAAQISEATGLEMTQIYPTLTSLKNLGLAKKSEAGGWIEGDAKVSSKNSARPAATKARPAATKDSELIVFGDYAIVRKDALAALVRIIEQWK